MRVGSVGSLLLPRERFPPCELKHQSLLGDTRSSQKGPFLRNLTRGLALLCIKTGWAERCAVKCISRALSLPPSLADFFFFFKCKKSLRISPYLKQKYFRFLHSQQVKTLFFFLKNSAMALRKKHITRQRRPESSNSLTFPENICINTPV